MIKNYLLLALKLSIILLIVFLGASTLVPQGQPTEFYTGHYPGLISPLILFFRLHAFYSSGLNIGLWIWIALHLIGLTMMPGYRRWTFRLLILILIGMLGVIIYDKTHNHRYNLVMKEGRIFDPNDLIRDSQADSLPTMRLLAFKIEYYPGSQHPSEYHSRILLDEQDTVSLKVNHPLKIGNYRLYQSSYQAERPYELFVNNRQFSLNESDTLMIGQVPVHIVQTDTIRRTVHVEYGGEFYRLTEGMERIVGQDALRIERGGERLNSQVELVEFTGISWLVLLGYLLLPILMAELIRIRPGEI